MYSHRIFDTSCTNKSEFLCDTECDDSENSFGAIGGKEIGENLTALVHLQSLSFGWVKFYFLIKIVYVVQVLEWSPISSESSSFFFFTAYLDHCGFNSTNGVEAEGANALRNGIANLTTLQSLDLGYAEICALLQASLFREFARTERSRAASEWLVHRGNGFGPNGGTSIAAALVNLSGLLFLDLS